MLTGVQVEDEGKVRNKRDVFILFFCCQFRMLLCFHFNGFDAVFGESFEGRL